jgi:hypothetical protein
MIQIQNSESETVYLKNRQSNSWSAVIPNQAIQIVQMPYS